MIGAHFLFAIFWMTISCSVSMTWSSNINSLFSGKSFMLQTVGVSKELIESVAYGAQVGMNHCKDVFKWDRWNCPESAFSRRHQQTSTKEQAVAHAIVSAGIAHSVARNCSRGQLKGCGCDPKLGGRIATNTRYIAEKRNAKETKVEWSWGGCSDNVEFGQEISKTVLDELERGEDTRALTNLHNNLVGRAVVRNTMLKRCRCHGISGSCALQTCWMQVAPFAKIANTLRERYRKAKQIAVENRANSFPVDSSEPNSETVVENFPKFNTRALVFIEKSPNFCRENNTTGWPGTKGRACSRSRSENVSLLEKRSCRHLCRKCGYRVHKHKRPISFSCNCKFKWCCEVKCDTCTKIVEEYFCE